MIGSQEFEFYSRSEFSFLIDNLEITSETNILHYCAILLHTHLQGHNHGWKVEGDQGLGPNTGAPRPAKGRAGCWVREGVTPSCCEGPGVSPPENFWKPRC